ncbi:hypothetical protein HBH53_050040 [Parastagonospora nodorum]|nr:hypothetical protein HBH53_050040 [Parastagonospora nodorum]
MSDHETIPESEKEKSDVARSQIRKPRGAGFAVGKKASMKVRMLDKDGDAVLDWYDFTVTASRKDRTGRYEYQLNYSGASYERGNWFPEKSLEVP